MEDLKQLVECTGVFVDEIGLLNHGRRCWRPGEKVTRRQGEQRISLNRYQANGAKHTDEIKRYILQAADVYF